MSHNLANPERVKAYRGDNCGEISLEHSGPLYYQCSHGCEGGWETTLKGRVVCYNCRQFLKKMTEISCTLCEDNEHGDEVYEIEAFKCPLCQRLVENNWNYPHHLSVTHGISLADLAREEATCA